MLNDEQYMQRCLELAQRGEGFVESNPMVACVIVHRNKVIAEAYHKKFGEAHAEVLAIRQVRDPSLLKESTLYVNLEPCSHYGKTPPCADLIIENKPARVVIAMQDPNPKVQGKGIDKLQKAGIEVSIGVLEAEARKLNETFAYFHENKMPFITLKWAETADGFMGRAKEKNEANRKISNAESDLYVHRLRSLHNAILIGSETANRDNPLLDARMWKGADPVKIILSPANRINPKLDLFKKGRVIIYNLEEENQEGEHIRVKLIPEQFIENTLKDMAAREISSVLVEGGRQILQAFIDDKRWNRIVRIISEDRWHSGIASPLLGEHRPYKTERVGNNSILYYSRNERN